MHKLPDSSFKGGEQKFITVSKFGVRLSKEASDHKICLNKQKMKDAVSCLLLNYFFIVDFLPHDWYNYGVWHSTILCQSFFILLRKYID